MNCRFKAETDNDDEDVDEDDVNEPTQIEHIKEILNTMKYEYEYIDIER